MSSDPQKAKEQKAAIAPMLSVRNGARAIEFYKAAFGAMELYRVDNDAGQVVGRMSAGAPNSGSSTNLRSTPTSALSLSAAVLFEWR